MKNLLHTIGCQSLPRLVLAVSVILAATASHAVEQVAISKAVTQVTDPLGANPANPLPGDTVTYQLTISNSSSASEFISNVDVTDVVPAGTTFVAGSTVVSGAREIKIFRDNIDNGTGFSSDALPSGDDGINTWFIDWTEINEADGETAGDERIFNIDSRTILRVRDNDSGGEGVYREVNLIGCSAAKVNFVLADRDLDPGDDEDAFVESSNNGSPTNFASGWSTLLHRTNTGGGTQAYIDYSIEIPLADIGANTRIRFRTGPNNSPGAGGYFDNIQITAVCGVVADFTGGNASTLLDSDDVTAGIYIPSDTVYGIADGGSFTITYDVLVGDTSAVISNTADAEILDAWDASSVDTDTSATNNTSKAGAGLDDAGDAPDTSSGNGIGDYTTLIANNGPWHRVVAGTFLGDTAPDVDYGGFANGTDASFDATDDDAGGDEGEAQLINGASSIVALDVLAASYSLTIDYSAAASATMFAWIDFDQNGVFEEEERQTVSGLNGSGSTTLTWSSFPGVSTGFSYARFRITTDTIDVIDDVDTAEDDASLGFADDGEVEDYQILLSGLDYGDSPISASGDYDDTNNSGAADAGDDAARHFILPNVRLGNIDPDNELLTFNDGTDATGTARDDDTEGSEPDDEEGISSLPNLLTSATSYSLTLTVNTTGTAANAHVYAWIDFDRDGIYETAEQATLSNDSVVLSGGLVPAGANGTILLDWSGITPTAGGYNLRVRLSTDDLDLVSEGADVDDDASLGLANDGEVEDYQLLGVGLDYGDAPIPGGSGEFDDTNSDDVIDGSDTPARHSVVAGIRLGNINPDADTGVFGNGSDANGDATDDDTPNDPLGNFDDEDGVANLAPIAVSASTHQLNLRLVNGSGLVANVYAWIDFDNDGLWEESERATLSDDSITGTTATTAPIGASGTVNLNWSGLPALGLGDVYMRVRMTSDNLDLVDDADDGVQDDAATGDASNGEVEDYAIDIINAQDFGDVPIAMPGYYDDGFTAVHTVVAGLQLGLVAPDVDSGAWANGTDVNGDASDDDSLGSAPDDEDGITAIPQLSSATSNYQVVLRLDNSSGSAANVYAWIDFDRNNQFDENEIASLSSTGDFTPAGLSVPNGASGDVNLDWTVPVDIDPGTSYMRVRITTDGLTADGTDDVDERSQGSATDGEIEDYQLSIIGIDFGDAPDATPGNSAGDYSSLETNSGPSHRIISGLYLGNTAADVDSDAFGNGTDTSLNANDDEAGGDEGITQLLNSGSNFPVLNVTDTSYVLSLDAFNNTGTDARIYAWIDFDRDGEFDENEIANGGPVGIASSAANQVVAVTWSGLAGLTSGATYARFRITNEIPTANGAGEDERSLSFLNSGEVEDYEFTIGNFDYGDAPDASVGVGPGNYRSLLADDGPRHVISSSLYLGDGGPIPDLDSDAFGDGTDTTFDATDDDITGTADEDIDDLLAAASVFPTLQTSSSSYSITLNYNNTSGGAARIYAWIDFDQSGTFDVDEVIEALVGTGASQTTVLTWPLIPNDITHGDTYARFRITTASLTAPVSGEDTRSYGLLANGEVEDHQITIIGIDFGDAPSSYGTFLAGSGPRHTLDTDLFLGNIAPDGDANGFGNGVVNNADASDDDTEGVAADEGVAQLLFSGASFPALNATDNTYALNVEVTNQTGGPANLYAWIDFNDDGSFDAIEQSLTVVPDGTVAASIALSWSGIAVQSVVSATYARFRLTTNVLASSLGAASDGEVEDYAFNILGTTTISGVVFEDINFGGGAGRNYTIANASFPSVDVGVPARVELWSSDGTTCTTFDSFTTASATGTYSFASIAAPGNYCVRVVTDSVNSSRSATAGLIPVQSYRSESTDGTGSIVEVINELGGRSPASADTANATFSAQTAAWSLVQTSGAAVIGIDFGLSYNLVVNTNDAGQGSLRQFMINANAQSNSNLAQQFQSSGLDVSIFAIPTSDSSYNLEGEGEYTITAASALPATTAPLELNATTQDGVTCPKPLVQLKGSTGNGFDIGGGSSMVAGFIVNGWSLAGVRINSANNDVSCNYIGTNAAGNTALANGSGVQIVSGDGNTIGGGADADANVISANTGVGLAITSDSNQVLRNIIGLASNALSRLDNGSHGITIVGSTNEIGTVSISSANTIAYNNGDGIRVTGGAGSTSNEIRINSIYNNANLAVDLGGDGIDIIDVNDPDTGENTKLNTIAFTSVTVSSNDLVVDADLNVDTGVYTVEYYANPVCNGDQNGLLQVGTPAGEGQQLLGSVSVIAASDDVTEAADVTLSGVVSSLVGGQITAKVTEDGGNSSEFSACFEAIAPQLISGTVFEDINYGGGVGRNLAAATGVGVEATVELWTSDGVNCTGSSPVQAITANSGDGSYQFATVQPGAEYCVRVVNSTVHSSRAAWVPGLLPIQTYRTDYEGDGAGLVSVTDYVGGESPSDVDAAVGVMDSVANDGSRTQSIAMIDLADGGGDAANIDFGFNFSSIVNVNGSGQGSLRQFLTNATTFSDQASLVQSGTRITADGTTTEALPSGIESSIFMLSIGGATAGLTANYPNLLSGTGVGEITLASSFSIGRSLISLDGTTQSVNVFGNNATFYNSGVTLGRNGVSMQPTHLPEIQVAGSNIDIEASNIQIRGIAFLPTNTALNVISGSNTEIEQNAFGTSASLLTDPASGNGDNLINISSATGSLTANIVAYGNASGVDIGVGGNGWTITDTQFNNNDLEGLLAEQVSGLSVTQSLFDTNGDGLVLGTGITTATVDDSTMTANVNTGVNVIGVSAISAAVLTNNLILENSGAGVGIDASSSGIELTQNNIYNNGGLGIDLENDGLTANDGTDADTGANLRLNFPVINSVTANGTLATINTTLTSNKSGLEIELYSSATCNPNVGGTAQATTHGEGEKYHSTTSGVASGVAENINVTTTDLAGQYITLIARDANGNTSEFSACGNATFDDYGDAPNSYGTNNAADGARHRTNSTIHIGTVDTEAEVDGFGGTGTDSTAGLATDDDTTGTDDEDIGTALPLLTSAMKSYTITVNNVNNTGGSPAELTAWIDFDLNGSFDNDEAASITVPAATTNISFDLDWFETPVLGQGSIPIDISSGASYVRFRLSTDATVLTGDPTTSFAIGAATDGEVEDYTLTILTGADYGDAPDSYDTLDASGGPFHARNVQLYMGSVAPDGEFDGVPATAGAEADGDDVNSASDDEDGVNFGGLTPTSIDFDISVDVINTTGDNITIHAWLDINHDGDFADADEYASTSLAGGVGSINDVAVSWNHAGFNADINSNGGISGAVATYFRVRLAKDSEGLTSSDWGGDGGDGEVEDYRVIVSELTCNELYVQNYETSIRTGDKTDVRLYDPTAPLLSDTLTHVLSTTVSTNGTALDPITRRYYYFDRDGDSSVYYNDGSGEVDTGVNISPASNYNRSAFNPDGQLWFLDSVLASGEGLRAFDVSGATITAVTLSDTTIANHADNDLPANILLGSVDVTTTRGGDIAFDLDGNMYLLSYDATAATEFYLFRIADLYTNPTAVWLRTTAVPGAVSGSNAAQTAGAAFYTDDSLYLFAVGGYVFSWDLGADILTSVSDMTLDTDSLVYGSPDAASCIFPLLRPSLIVEKEVFNVTDAGSPGFTPGDILRYRITVENVGVFLADSTTFIDAIPAHSTYITGSTTLNGSGVPDSGAQMPYESVAPINSPSGAAGIIEPGETAVIEFLVQLDVATDYIEVCNDAAIVEFTDVATVSTSSGDTIQQATDNPQTIAIPTYPAVGGISDDPTCLDKVSGYAIEGTVYEDVSVDGINDGTGAGEDGIASVEVVLRNVSAGTCETTFTDASGNYSFGPLDGGSYVIYEADGATIPTPSTCPPIEADPGGYVSSTANSLGVTVTNANISGQDFGDVRPPLFTPNNSGIVQPGNSIVYAHTLSPRTDGTVSFSFSESTVPIAAGWSVTLYLDNNCDNGLDGGDSIISGSVAATEGVDICILSRVTAPGSAGAGNLHYVDVDAIFDFPGVSVADSILSVTDTTTVVSADDGALLLIKTVENVTLLSPYYNAGIEQVSNEGEPGDELLYRISYQNVGSTDVSDIDIYDTTPAFTSLSAVVDCTDARGPTAIIPLATPASLACSVIAAPIVNGAGAVQWRLIGTLAAGDKGLVVFSVTID